MANPPLPNRGVVPFLDADGKSVSVPWYRAFQALQGQPGAKGDPGSDGGEGPAGPPGTDDGEALAMLSLSLLDESTSGVIVVSSANGALSVANPTTTVILTINSAPKWTTARTLSFTGAVTGSNTVDGSANVAFAMTNPIATTFGTGAPSTLVGEGALYFDTTNPIYIGYVQHSSAWHQIA